MNASAMISIEHMRSLETDASGAGKRSRRRGGKAWARIYLTKIRVVYLVLKHPKSPPLAKAVGALSLGYIFSPIQLIPSFIPVIGWVDDVAVLSVGMWLLVRLTPAEILQQCREAAARREKLPRDTSPSTARTWRFLQ